MEYPLIAGTLAFINLSYSKKDELFIDMAAPYRGVSLLLCFCPSCEWRDPFNRRTGFVINFEDSRPAPLAISPIPAT